MSVLLNFKTESSRKKTALAAALVHDLGHGMFSHSFEEVGKKLDIKMAHHENVSDLLIRKSEITEILKEMGSGFANDVADVIKQGRPVNLYDAVVSSQFDADRLDYMQRDRFMTGVQNSGIDFTWLMANLEIGEVPVGVDDKKVGKVKTFVLGNKASHAAETYVLGLFQLYPTVYLHKTTRGAEKIFTELMLRTIELVRNGQVKKVGLAATHPIVRFAKDSESLDNALALDDTVLWGALPVMAEAKDKLISECAVRLRDRKLMKCIDVGHTLASKSVFSHAKTPDDRIEAKKLMDRLVAKTEKGLQGWTKKKSKDFPRILTDRTERHPYKKFQESKGSLNQIHIRTADKRILDVAEFSSVIKGLETFEVFRAYISEEDADARSAISSIVDKVVKEEIGSTGHV